MKKIFRVNIVLIMFLIIFSLNCLASTNTTKRTEDNLMIADDITVNSSNKQIILKTPKVNEQEKIYDFGNLLSDQEETLLYNKAVKFVEENNLDVVIVTINDNNKISARDYADDFYDYNYFGTGTTHDGLLFLIDMDNREMWISTTGQGQRIYDDNRIDNILDYTYDKISKQDYYGCANVFLDKADALAKKGIPSSNENTYIDEDGDYIYTGDSYEDKFPIGFIIFASIIFTAIFILFKANKHRTVKKATNAMWYLRNLNITRREDNFVTTHTSKIYDPPSDSGSSGGGSSTHFSSSGRSHGGGGRSF